jgi:YHS domain-containing protein
LAIIRFTPPRLFKNLVGQATEGTICLPLPLSSHNIHCMKRFLASLVGLLCFTLYTSAQNSEIFTTDDGAIQGYDAVAYFTESKAVKGSKEFTFIYAGEMWSFASLKNLQKFKKEPDKYAPQFGGYCAYGMSRGYKAKTDPEAWTIVNDKLYLNYNLDVRNIWNEKQTEFIEKANSNWPMVKTAKLK